MTRLYFKKKNWGVQIKITLDKHTSWREAEEEEKKPAEEEVKKRQATNEGH